MDPRTNVICEVKKMAPPLWVAETQPKDLAPLRERLENELERALEDLRKLNQLLHLLVAGGSPTELSPLRQRLEEELERILEDLRKFNQLLLEPTKEWASMVRLSASLHSQLAVPDVVAEMVRSLAEGLGYQRIALLLFQETSGELVGQGGVGVPGLEQVRVSLTGDGPLQRALATQSQVQAEGPEAIPELPGFSHWTIVPLRARGQTLGLLVAEPQPLSEDLWQVYVGQASLALANALLRERHRQTLHELEQAHRIKTDFLANMSHELRTPLNAIIGFSEVLQQGLYGELTPRQQRCVQNIHTSGQHLLELVNDVLDITAIEAGRLDLEYSSIEVAELMEETLAPVRSLAQRKGLTLSTHFEPRLPPLEADRARVKQVLSNLLDNALKFTPEGGAIRVTATLRDRSSPGKRGPATGAGAPQLAVAVQDTGPGIPRALQEHIFRSFEQLDSSLGRPFQGTGLGLTLARHLAEMHGGTIEVDSQEGVGSTFTVLLPLRPPPTVQPVTVAAEPPRGQRRIVSRVYFEQRLFEETSRADRYNRVFSLLLIGLEPWADPETGVVPPGREELATALGDLLVKNVRAADPVARYAEGVFAVILPEQDIVGARQVAAKVHRLVTQLDETGQSLTVNVGVGTYGLHGLAPLELLERVQAALQAARTAEGHGFQEAELMAPGTG